VASENPASPYYTCRMDVSPTGQGPAQQVIPNLNDTIPLLHLIANLQNQTLEMQRQMLELQRQQLEISRELAQVNREQRARQISELERWQSGHEYVLDSCRESLTQLEQVHASLMGDLTSYVKENYENLVDGEYALTDFVDRFGPRLAHLNTMLAVLRPLAVSMKKAES
jgi:chromosome segregation ATPase